jgi:hypothetical protein
MGKYNLQTLRTNVLNRSRTERLLLLGLIAFVLVNIVILFLLLDTRSRVGCLERVQRADVRDSGLFTSLAARCLPEPQKKAVEPRPIENTYPDGWENDPRNPKNQK